MPNSRATQPCNNSSCRFQCTALDSNEVEWNAEGTFGYCCYYCRKSNFATNANPLNDHGPRCRRELNDNVAKISTITGNLHNAFADILAADNAPANTRKSLTGTHASYYGTPYATLTNAFDPTNTRKQADVLDSLKAISDALTNNYTAYLLDVSGSLLDLSGAKAVAEAKLVASSDVADRLPIVAGMTTEAFLQNSGHGGLMDLAHTIQDVMAETVAVLDATKPTNDTSFMGQAVTRLMRVVLNITEKVGNDIGSRQALTSITTAIDAVSGAVSRGSTPALALASATVEAMNQVAMANVEGAYANFNGVPIDSTLVRDITVYIQAAADAVVTAANATALSGSVSDIINAVSTIYTGVTNIHLTGGDISATTMANCVSTVVKSLNDRIQNMTAHDTVSTVLSATNISDDVTATAASIVNS